MIKLCPDHLANWKTLENQSYALLFSYVFQDVYSTNYIRDIGLPNMYNDEEIDVFGRTWVHYSAGIMSNDKNTNYDQQYIPNISHYLTLKRDVNGNTPIMYQLTKHHDSVLDTMSEIEFKYPSLDHLINEESVNISNKLNQIPSCVNKYSTLPKSTINL